MSHRALIFACLLETAKKRPRVSYNEQDEIPDVARAYSRETMRMDVDVAMDIDAARDVDMGDGETFLKERLRSHYQVASQRVNTSCGLRSLVIHCTCSPLVY